MKLTDGTYLCPFCLSSFLCEGPHIKQEEENSIREFMYYAKIDHIEVVLEEILKYQSENMVDLSSLANSIKSRLLKRDK